MDSDMIHLAISSVRFPVMSAVLLIDQALMAASLGNHFLTPRQPNEVFVACFLSSYEYLNYQQPQGPVNALRLVVEYKDGLFYLKKMIPIKTILPPSDPEPKDQSGTLHSGFWLELHSVSKAVLYRRIMADPVVQHTETIEPDSGRLRRDEYLPRQKYFSIVIPDLPGGVQVLFFSSALGNLVSPSEPAAGEISRARAQPAQFVGSILLPKRR